MKLIVLITTVMLIVSTIPTIVSGSTSESDYCVVDTERCWKGHGSEYWHWEYVKAQKKVNRLKAKLKAALASPSPGGSMYAIKLASSAYGVPYWELYNVARCETGGTFSPWAANPTSTASGLFQFLDSTWASQGMQGFSVWDPVANALAAARIVAREGWGQWVCKP